jgi:hypothetical protein
MLWMEYKRFYLQVCGQFLWPKNLARAGAFLDFFFFFLETPLSESSHTFCLGNISVTGHRKLVTLSHPKNLNGSEF